MSPEAPQRGRRSRPRGPRQRVARRLPGPSRGPDAPDGLREIHVRRAHVGSGFAGPRGATLDAGLAARLAAEGVSPGDGPARRDRARHRAWLGGGRRLARPRRRPSSWTTVSGARTCTVPARAPARCSGTLDHRVVDDPFAAVGRQDLTAHVDFTAVERAADRVGFEVLGRTTQSEFLVDLGLQDVLERVRSDPGQRWRTGSRSARPRPAARSRATPAASGSSCSAAASTEAPTMPARRSRDWPGLGRSTPLHR